MVTRTWRNCCASMAATNKLWETKQCFRLHRTVLAKRNAASFQRGLHRLRLFWRWPNLLDLKSEVAEEVAPANAQDLGDFEQRTQRDLHVPKFDFTDEIVMQVGALGQFLLREIGSLAICAKRFPHDSEIVVPLRQYLLRSRRRIPDL